MNGTLTPIGYLDGGQGERTDAGGSHYVSGSLGVGSETKGGATTYYTRTPSGHLVSQRTAAGSYYYLFDGLGSVVGLVDPFGNLAARYGYDPYGQQVVKHGPDSNPTYLTIADGNPFRYTGAYLDGTGLYKMGERYYDPARGRFTQLDPLGNGYVYASDDPINLSDPSGLCDPQDCGGEPGDDLNGPLDPFAEPIDAHSIDFTNPPLGYPEITFKSGHIFDEPGHGFDGLDPSVIERGIASDVYSRFQIGDINENIGVIDRTPTHFYVGDQSIDVIYEGYVYPDGSQINISSAWRPGFNK